MFIKMDKKRDNNLVNSTPITRNLQPHSSIESSRSLMTNSNNIQLREERSRWSIHSLKSFDFNNVEESFFDVSQSNKHENVLVNQLKDTSRMLSSDNTQLIPKSRYASLVNSENRQVGSRANSQDGLKVKEYLIDLMSLEKEQNPISVLQDQSKKEIIPEKNNYELLIPNIPFSLCISYFRQEKSQICKKLQSVWRGYKTRSILRGSLRGLTNLEMDTGNEVLPYISKIYLGYNIHKILLSIVDLYDLILDEESKSIQTLSSNSTSWLDAMYEQVGDYKRKYILEVNYALQGDHGRRWVSDIINSRGTTGGEITRKPRDKKSLLPMKFEAKYNDKILKSGGSFLKFGKQMLGIKRVGEERLSGENLDEITWNKKLMNDFTQIYLPYSLVKSNSLDEISSYLGIKTEQVINIIQENSLSKQGGIYKKNSNISPKLSNGFELTPVKTNRTREFDKEVTPFQDKSSPNIFTGGNNSNMYFTPNSLVHGLSKNEIQDCVEYYTPIQDEIGISMSDYCENRNFYIENHQLVQKLNNNVKPKPYLKRKSKSIMPSRETNIELDKITSKVKELYKSKNLNEKKVTRKVSVSNGYDLSGSRIPSLTSTLSIVSDSPSSRNSSSKISRIPKYNNNSNSFSVLKSCQNSREMSTPQIIRSKYSNF